MSQAESPTDELKSASPAPSIASSVTSATSVIWTTASSVRNYLWGFLAALNNTGEENTSKTSNSQPASSLSLSHRVQKATDGEIDADGNKMRKYRHSFAQPPSFGIKDLTESGLGEISPLTEVPAAEVPVAVDTVQNAVSHVAYLDLADYGIRLVGRNISIDPASIIVTQGMIDKIHTALPPRFRLSTKWRLVYSTTEHGFSLATLYSRSKYHEGPTLLAVRDEFEEIFGVFATESWRPHVGHYGTGECFLWRLQPDGRIKKWGTTGKNIYFMISEPTYLAAGVGDGRYGFWLDEELLGGHSHPVCTFENESLSSKADFKCVNLELWGLDMNPLN